jgi:hypothetical protein
VADVMKQRKSASASIGIENSTFAEKMSSLGSSTCMFQDSFKGNSTFMKSIIHEFRL